MDSQRTPRLDDIDHDDTNSLASTQVTAFSSISMANRNGDQASNASSYMPGMKERKKKSLLSIFSRKKDGKLKVVCTKNN